MRRPVACLFAFAALSASGEDKGVWSTWSALREGDGCRREQTSLVPTPFRVCPGPERMRVLVETRGDRSWIDLVPEGTPLAERISLEQVLQHERFGRHAHVSGGFIEWRYEGRSLMGLLVLMQGLEDKPGDDRHSGWAVVRFDREHPGRNCLAGIGETIEGARKIADDATQGCRAHAE